MENLVAGDLTINITNTAGILGLDWRGKSADRQPQIALSPFFEEVATAAAAQPASIEMHFENLEHFNSSTITVLIQFIQKLRQKNIKLRIVFNSGFKWQRLSFDALRIFEKPDGLLTFGTVQN